jgi:hypothetical protein
MKIMHKIILSMFATAAVIPGSVRANALTRVINKQNLLTVAKNPGVVMAVAGAASLGVTAWCRKKISSLNPDKRRQGKLIEIMKQRSFYFKLSDRSRLVALGLWGMSANYALFSAANRFGYIKKASANGKVASFAGIIASLAVAKGASIAKEKLAYDALDDASADRKYKAAELIEPVAAESAAALATYLLWFA